MPSPADVSLERLWPVLVPLQLSVVALHAGGAATLVHGQGQPGQGVLYVLQRGTWTLWQAGELQALRLGEPTLLLYPRPVWHRLVPGTDPAAELRWGALRFEGGHSQALLRALPARLLVPLCAVDGLQATLELLFAEAERVRCEDRVLAGRLLELVLLQVLRWQLRQPQGGGLCAGLLAGLAHAELARTLAQLHAQPGQHWSLARMAEQAALSRSAFAAKFKAVLGQAPADYLSDWRIALAQKQLLQGQSVKCVAHALGYAHASALSRVFARRVGLSPRAWLALQPAVSQFTANSRRMPAQVHTPRERSCPSPLPSSKPSSN